MIELYLRMMLRVTVQQYYRMFSIQRFDRETAVTTVK